MIQQGLPFDKQLLLDFLFPPIGAIIWLILSRGFAGAVQGGNVSETTKNRQRIEFWVVLSIAYVMMFGITLYHRFFG